MRSPNGRLSQSEVLIVMSWLQFSFHVSLTSCFPGAAGYKTNEKVKTILWSTYSFIERR